MKNLLRKHEIFMDCCLVLKFTLSLLKHKQKSVYEEYCERDYAIIISFQ